MGKTEKNIFTGALFQVCRFVSIAILIFITLSLFLFEVELDVRNYDIVFAPRYKADVYYGINYAAGLEIWKVKKDENGVFSIQQIYSK